MKLKPRPLHCMLWCQDIKCQNTHKYHLNQISKEPIKGETLRKQEKNGKQNSEKGKSTSASVKPEKGFPGLGRRSITHRFCQYLYRIKGSLGVEKLFRSFCDSGFWAPSLILAVCVCVFLSNLFPVLVGRVWFVILRNCQNLKQI